MFLDPDPIEQDMGLPVEEMNPDQLVAYLKTYHAAYGLDMAVEGHQERAIFRSMQKIYGQRTAGRIVKWVTYTHKGRWDGVPVRFTSFCKGRKWWVDLDAHGDAGRASGRPTRRLPDATVLPVSEI